MLYSSRNRFSFGIATAILLYPYILKLLYFNIFELTKYSLAEHFKRREHFEVRFYCYLIFMHS